MNKAYEFCYTDCIYESAMYCVSLHKTKKGAENAMNLHKEMLRREFIKMEKRYMKEYNEPSCIIKFGENSDWCVREREILE